jgi:hypothetical protein
VLAHGVHVLDRRARSRGGRASPASGPPWDPAHRQREERRAAARDEDEEEVVGPERLARARGSRARSFGRSRREPDVPPRPRGSASSEGRAP